MGTAIGIGISIAAQEALTGSAAVDNLLLETGDDFLLKTGDFILLES